MGNVHLVTGYAGKQHVTAADQGSFNAALVGAGEYVLKRGNMFAASVVTNNKITIQDGDLVMQGRHVRLNEGSTVDLTIENGQQGYKRHDLIVARYTKNAETDVEDVNLVVIKGTAAASTAADPEYTAGDIINDHVLLNDMPLYRVVLDGLNVQPLEQLFTIGGIPSQDDIDAIAKTAMPKTGGTFTGNAMAAASTNEATAMLRNIVVVEAGTDLSTLSVPAGTIIMVKK